MRPNEVWALGCLAPLQDDINAFTQKLLESYIAKLRNGFSPKESMIYDTVWGNIEFSGAEITLIDSPLFQRLRHISQLGLASLLYPGATHTRFEHSLGVAHISGKFFDKALAHEFSDTQKKDFTDAPDLEFRAILRIAALFHDIGHVFFSHIGERFFKSESYSRSKEIKGIIKHFRHKISAHIDGSTELISVNEGELLSALILTSPSVQELVALAYCQQRNAQQEAQAITSLAACFIIGLPVSNACAVFSQVITGCIDADKCDYLLRDSQRTGIPVVMDVNRIIAKLKISNHNIPIKTNVWESDSTTNSQVKTLALTFTAARNIDDVALSRSIMQEKVYSHQKVLVAEAMFFEALRRLDLANPQYFSSYENIYSIMEGDLVHEDPSCVLQKIAPDEELSPEQNENFNKAITLLKDIKQRNLLSRCCVFSNNDLESTTINTSENNKSSFLTDIFADTGSEKAREFIDKVKRTSFALGKILDFAPDKMERLEKITILLSSTPASTGQEISFPILTDDKCVPYNDLFSYDHWESGRGAFLCQFYIFSTREFTELLYISIHAVLLTDYEIKLTYESCYKSKINKSILSEYILLLIKSSDNDAYTKSAIELFKINHISESHIHRKLKHIFEKLRGKHETCNIENIVQIQNFIEQICHCGANGVTCIELCQATLTMLDSIIVVEHEDFSNHLKKSIHDNNLNDHTFIALGNLKDSASHLSYNFKYLLPDYAITPQSIEKLPNLLDDGCTDFVFFDDAFGSGKQTVDILQEIVGHQDRLLNETHGDVTLNEEQLSKFKQANITLLYCYGKEENKGFILQHLHDLGFKNCQIHYSHEFPEPYFKNVALAAEERLKNILEDVGRTLLKQKKGESWNKDDARFTTYALGYNDARLLISFPWNTPSYTLTALWCQGEYQGKEWKPLLPRHSK